MEAAQPDPLPAPPPAGLDHGRDDGERIQRALAFAYRYLNRRERTVAEMRSHLEGRHFDGEEIEHVLEVLVEQRLLDDARYAQLFTEDKRTLEQWGSERIRRALVGRGIERELVELALAAPDPLPHPTGDSPPAGDGELTRAVSLLQQRFGSPPGDGRERERMLGVLMRKGYESELALTALDVFADCADSPSVLRW